MIEVSEVLREAPVREADESVIFGKLMDEARGLDVYVEDLRESENSRFVIRSRILFRNYVKPTTASIHRQLYSIEEIYPGEYPSYWSAWIDLHRNSIDFTFSEDPKLASVAYRLMETQPEELPWNKVAFFDMGEANQYLSASDVRFRPVRKHLGHFLFEDEIDYLKSGRGVVTAYTPQANEPEFESYIVREHPYGHTQNLFRVRASG